MKTGYTKLVLWGLIVLVVVFLFILLIDPITGVFDQIIKALEGLGR